MFASMLFVIFLEGVGSKDVSEGCPKSVGNGVRNPKSKSRQSSPGESYPTPLALSSCDNSDFLAITAIFLHVRDKTANSDGQYLYSCKYVQHSYTCIKYKHIPRSVHIVLI